MSFEFSHKPPHLTSKSNPIQMPNQGNDQLPEFYNRSVLILIQNFCLLKRKWRPRASLNRKDSGGPILETSNNLVTNLDWSRTLWKPTGAACTTKV